MPIDRAPGADQRPSAPIPGQGRQFRGAAGAEDHPGRGGEVERRQGHRPLIQPVSAMGNTGWKLVDVRGRAIIGATVSRQLA